MSTTSSAMEKLNKLLERANKPGAYDDSELRQYQCTICMDFPEDGLYALTGCCNGHDTCKNCMIDLQQRAGAHSGASLKCPECRGVVRRPQSGWHPTAAVAKQRLLQLQPVPCCMDGCDFLGPISGIITHIEEVHAGDFHVNCHLKCGWHGKQCDLAKHMEEVDHTKLLHPFVLETNEKVAALETALVEEREANATFRREMMEMMRTVQSNTGSTSISVGRIMGELDLDMRRGEKTALATIEHEVSAMKRDFDTFKTKAEPQLEERLTKVSRRVCDLAPDQGFPGGIQQSKMYARRALRAWWGLPEKAEGTTDWSVFEDWAYEHMARMAAAGKELRVPQDDGAPIGWKRSDAVRALAIDTHWYTDTRQKAQKAIADSKKYSHEIARSGAVFQPSPTPTGHGSDDDGF